MRFARAALAAAILALSTAAASAQSGCAIFVYGAVATPGQWNQCLQTKQDLLGYVPLNTNGGAMSGRLSTAPSTLGRAGFAIAPGTAPSAPVNGDLWMTNLGLYAQVNGATVGPFASASSIPTVSQGDLLYGSAPGVLSTLPKSTTATQYVSNTGSANNPAWAQVDLSTGVMNRLPLSGLATGTQDTILGYFSSTSVTAQALPNCSTALTYSTSTHLPGCNSSIGTGTVTSVASGAGLTGGPITTSGTLSISLPRLEAYIGTNQGSVVDSTATLLTFDTVATDSNSWFNTSTHLYTPQIAGSYLVTVKVRCNAATTLTACTAQINKNSTDWARSSGGPASTVTGDGMVTSIVAVNGTTDTLSGYGIITGTGGSEFFTGNWPPMLTYISIVYIGP